MLTIHIGHVTFATHLSAGYLYANSIIQTAFSKPKRLLQPPNALVYLQCCSSMDSLLHMRVDLHHLVI